MQNSLLKCKNWLLNILGEKLHKKLLTSVNEDSITYLPKSNLYLKENKLCFPGEIIELEDLKLLEEVSVRMDIEVLGPDIPKLEPFDHNTIIIDPRKRIIKSNRHLLLGWAVHETISMSLVNPEAITKLSKMENLNE